MRTARVLSLLAAGVGAVLLFVPVTWDDYRCGSAVVPGSGLPVALAQDDRGIGGIALGPLVCADVLGWIRLVGVSLVVVGVVAVLLLTWALRARTSTAPPAADPDAATPRVLDLDEDVPDDARSGGAGGTGRGGDG